MWNLVNSLRTLTREPWSTAAIVCTLGVGIGASTVVYAVFNHALLRPVPGVDADARLVHVASADSVPLTHLVAATALPAFDRLAGQSEPPPTPVVLHAGAAPDSVEVVSVTRDYFDVLGVRAMAGRLFSAEEYEVPGTLVAVISDRLWRSAFGSRDMSATVIQVGGRPFTIVGVVRQFRGLSRTGGQDIWVPWGAGALRGTSVGRPLTLVDTVIGRLAPGMSEGHATSQLAALFAQDGPPRRGAEAATPRVERGLPGPSDSARAGLQTTLVSAFAGAVLLLALACANGASQLIARNIRRRREFAVRAALGASRARLLRDLLSEMGVISVCAAVVGLAVAATLQKTVATFELRGHLPLADVSIDWLVMACAIVTATATVLVAGVWPSVLASRADPMHTLRGTGRGASKTGRGGGLLVALQLAASMVLVACAGLLHQSMSRWHQVDLGFPSDGLVFVDEALRPSSVGLSGDQAQRFHAELQRRLSEVPGILSAAYADSSPLGSAAGSTRVATAAEAPLSASHPVRAVSSGYFETMGLPILAGRDFTVTEGAAASLSGRVIVDELLAMRLFGQTDAVGRRIWLEPSWLVPGARPSAEIVGVVGSSLSRDVRAGHQPLVFVPAGERTTAVHHVRTVMQRPEIRAAMRGVVADMAPLLVVGELVTTREQLDALAADTAILSRASLVFAGLAVLLSLSGAYAVTARIVSERIREYGIRMALGSSPAALRMTVLSGMLVTAILGLGLGLGMYAGLVRFLESWLFDITATDWVTVVSACATTILASLAAAWIPARRAMRVDPCISLRAE